MASTDPCQSHRCYRATRFVDFRPLGWGTTSLSPRQGVIFLTDAEYDAVNAIDPGALVLSECPADACEGW